LVVLKYNRFGPGYKPPKDHNHKLGPLGTPLHIIEKLSPLAYRLALPEESRIHDVVSIIHLKKFKGSGEGIRPLPIIVDETEEWEVERIDGERVNAQGVNEFLVKWHGYGEQERSWEPISHLERAGEVIAEWHSRRPDHSRKDRSRAKPDRHTRAEATPGDDLPPTALKPNTTLNEPRYHTRSRKHKKKDEVE
jgi:hypothetical protein